MCYRIMHTFKNTLRIILPYLCRYQRILRIYLEAVIADLVEYLGCGQQERNGEDVAKHLAVLKAFPNNLCNVIEIMGGLFLSDQK